MIELLSSIHSEVLQSVPLEVTRYLYNEINWDSKAICIFGDRGVGKTTLMCQYLNNTYFTAENALYLSADNINVISYGLFKIAQEYFAFGGQALFIDEVHKYPNWSLEIKNILDTFASKKIVFSASSSLDLVKSKGDLSRRVVYYELKGLSFREFIKLNAISDIPVCSVDEIVKNHIDIATKLKTTPILKHFKQYLEHGYYPFYLESSKDFLSKLNNVIEKVISEDITSVYNLKQNSIMILKKLLWLVASSEGLVPNIDKISRNIGASREIIYNCFEYLEHSGLIHNIRIKAQGMKITRKPGKVFLDNSNLLYAINTTLQSPKIIGNVRETFFVNQVSSNLPLYLHHKADFILENDFIFEIGGKNKKTTQIHNEENAFLAIDDIDIGFAKKIPLYMFGFLY